MVPGPQQRELERLHQVVALLRHAGVCWLCSLGMAIAVVEKEAGRAFDWRAQRGVCRVRRAADDLSCDERARRAWTASRAERKAA